MYYFPSLEPVCCSMSSSDCCFLTCVQTSQEAGQVVWYSHLFQNFLQFVVIHTVKGFGVVNKTEVEVFLELSFSMIQWMLAIWSLIAFSKSSLYIWNFLVHVLLKPSLKDFEHYLARMWNEHNCTVVWTFSGIAFLLDWNGKWLYSILWPLLSFPNLLAYWVRHFHSIIF